MSEQIDIDIRKVAIQGIEGCFHHVAANLYWKTAIGLVPSVTFAESINNTENGLADFAILAIENSLAGSIIPNYQLVRRSQLTICGEISLHIQQHLMALPGQSVTNIVEVHSHPMALNQCKEFLDLHPSIKRVETMDTAWSARNIAKKGLPGVAAIASDLAAERFGLHVLAENIESHKENFTRFLILEPKDRHDPLEKVDKASIYFEAPHTKGSLAKVLTCFADLDVNLAKLQSHPVPSKNTLYGFYADLEVRDRHHFESLSDQVGKLMDHMEVLGLYARGENDG